MNDVVDHYKNVVQNEGHMKLGMDEDLLEMSKKLTEKYLQGRRIRHSTLMKRTVEEDEEPAATLAQMLSGCTGFATFVMAQYIRKKYKEDIEKKGPDFDSYYFHGDGFSNIFNTYPGKLIFGITQPLNNICVL